MSVPGAYLASAGLVCHAGRGPRTVAGALRNPDIRPVGLRLDSLAPAVELPYLRADFETPDNRMLGMAQAAVSDALDGYSAAQRRQMMLFVATSTPDSIGREPDFAATLARGESAITLARPSTGLLAAYIAQDFALGGGQFSINTACSSGANALLYAAAALASGRCEQALVLGVEGPSRVTLAGFNSLMLASRTRCRPFDLDRDGLIIGEAAAAVVLSTKPPAGRTGMRLLGGASACDTASATQTDAGSIAAVIRAALADAGVDGVDTIKAHGTATPGNDSAEALGIAQVLGAGKLPLTSIKPALGHTLGACGVLETLAMAACWRAGFLPPTAGFATPDPALGVVPVTAAQPLAPGRMLLNYFGFGGNNCALVLEYQR